MWGWLTAWTKPRRTAECPSDRKLIEDYVRWTWKDRPDQGHMEDCRYCSARMLELNSRPGEEERQEKLAAAICPNAIRMYYATARAEFVARYGESALLDQDGRELTDMDFSTPQEASEGHEN